MGQIEDLTSSKTAQCNDDLLQQKNIKTNNSFKRKKTTFIIDDILRYFIIFAIITILITSFISYIVYFDTEEHKQHLIFVWTWIWNFVITSNTFTGFFTGLTFAKFINWLLGNKK